MYKRNEPLKIITTVLQGSHRSGKSQGKFYFLKVREKSVNFEIGQ